MIVYYLLVSILPLMQHPFWTMLYVGDVTMVKYVGLASVAFAIMHVAGRGRAPRFFETPQSWAFIILLAVVSVSYLSHGSAFRRDDSPLISFMSFLMFFFATVCLVDTIERLRWTLLVAIGSLAWATLYVIREWQKMGGRPGWVTGDPNYYTISCLLVIPIAYLFVRQEPKGWIRTFCLVSLVLIFVGVALAASRGGLIGMTVAVLYLISRSKRRVRDLIMFLAIFVPILLVAPDSPVRRLFAPDQHDDHSREIREILWAAGWQMIQEYPLTGIGLGNFKYTVARYQQDLDQPWENIAHNTYIELGAETGLPGALAFVALLTVTLLNLGRTRRAALAHGNQLLVAVATGIQAGLLGYATNAIFITAHYQKLLWLMIGLSMCLPALLRQLESQAERAPAATPRWKVKHVAVD